MASSLFHLRIYRSDARCAMHMLTCYKPTLKHAWRHPERRCRPDLQVGEASEAITGAHRVSPTRGLCPPYALVVR